MFNVRINERGQITIPKELRRKAKLNPKDSLLVDLDEKGRLIITKKDFFSDLEDLIRWDFIFAIALIRRDLINEGYSEYEVSSMIPKKKKELGEALLRMSADVQSEITDGKYSTLEDLNKELDPEEQ